MQESTPTGRRFHGTSLVHPLFSSFRLHYHLLKFPSHHQHSSAALINAISLPTNATTMFVAAATTATSDIIEGEATVEGDVEADILHQLIEDLLSLPSY